MVKKKLSDILYIEGKTKGWKSFPVVKKPSVREKKIPRSGKNDEELKNLIKDSL